MLVKLTLRQNKLLSLKSMKPMFSNFMSKHTLDSLKIAHLIKPGLPFYCNDNWKCKDSRFITQMAAVYVQTFCYRAKSSTEKLQVL